MDAKTTTSLPWWTWVIPFVLFHVGTQGSLHFQVAPGTALWYWPIPLGIVLVHWWGSRVLFGQYVNATLSATLWDLPWQWSPLYALPETLVVFLSWWLFTRRAKGQCWLPNLSQTGLFVVLGVLIPISIGGFQVQGQLVLLGNLEPDQFWVLFGSGWIADILAAIAVTTPILLFFTPVVERLGWSLTSGAKHSPLFPEDRQALKHKGEIAFLFLLVLALSVRVHLEEFWFVYGVVAIWAALRFGISWAVLISSWIVILTLLVPVSVAGPDGVRFAEQSTLIKVHTGLAVMYFAALLTGRTVSDWLTEMAYRKQAETAREQLIVELEAKNAELERFTYTVSHDLKSPLVTIRGFLGYLQQDAAEGDLNRLEQDVEQIRKASEKMQQLLDELLQLSRIGRIINPSESVSLTQLAQDARDLVATQIKLRGIHVEIAPAMPVVYGDRVRLLEVFENLLNNAIRYMGDQPKPHIELGSQGEDGEAVCYVRDNGMGIDVKYHEKIFGLFERLDASGQGTGIGLALVKRIVEVHGGRIWVDSEGVGKGSTFYFTLPKNGSPLA